ncbi:polyprenyl synthetase family protein [Streptomyces sp. NPDC054796]
MRDGLRTALSAFALPLGEAFQLRDDLLGVYGDPAVTGKPCLDDLRDGKHTALVALAMRLATPAQRRTPTTLIGSPHLDETGAGHLRRLLTATGARQQVERLVQDRLEQARQALEDAPVSAPVTAVLRQLAHQASVRTT